MLPDDLFEIANIVIDIFSQLLNAVETDNMATTSENLNLEEKKTVSENPSVNIETDQELLQDIFEKSNSIHESVKVDI